MADLATARREAEEALRNVEREKLVSHIREAAKFATRSERMVFLHDYEAKALVAVIDALRSALAASEPAPALPEEVREAAERTDKAMRDVFGGVDQFGDYCGHPIMPAKLAHAVQDLLAALAGGGK